VGSSQVGLNFRHASKSYRGAQRLDRSIQSAVAGFRINPSDNTDPTKKMKQRLIASCILLALAPLWASAQALSPDAVVASRGGAKLTVKDVDARMADVPESARGEVLENPQRLEQVLSDALLMKQLANEARAGGAERDPAFQAALARDAERLLALWRGNALLKEAPKADLQALARESYVADASRFKDADQVVVRHVLIRTGAGCRTDDQAKALAEKVQREAAAGKDFKSLVSSYSEDEASRAKDGQLPPIKRGRTEADFETAALALTKPGEVSSVVHSKSGYHVIQLVSREPGRQHSFDEVKDELARRMGQEQIQRYRKDHVDQLRSMALEADPDTVRALPDRYASPSSQAISPAAAGTETDPTADPVHRN
jgi:peptidyl-prolyl cis-trans isomerase C